MGTANANVEDRRGLPHTHMAGVGEKAFFPNHVEGWTRLISSAKTFPAVIIPPATQATPGHNE